MNTQIPHAAPILDDATYAAFFHSTENYRLFSRGDLLRFADCERVAYDLPRDFVFHHVREHWRAARPRLEALFATCLRRPSDATPMLDEMDALADAFCGVTGNTMPHYSLRVVTPEYLVRENPSVSGKWHRDSLAVTLTKSYAGDGAMLAPNENVRREYFVKDSIQRPHVSDADVLVDPTRVVTVPDGDVLLLKGEVYPEIDARSRELLDLFIDTGRVTPFNRGNGLIHKGGGFGAGDRRLVFTVSVYHPDKRYELPEYEGRPV
jgi:hypothetical protein